MHHFNAPKWPCIRTYSQYHNPTHSFSHRRGRMARNFIYIQQPHYIPRYLQSFPNDYYARSGEKNMRHRWRHWSFSIQHFPENYKQSITKIINPLLIPSKRTVYPEQSPTNGITTNHYISNIVKKDKNLLKILLNPFFKPEKLNRTKISLSDSVKFKYQQQQTKIPSVFSLKKTVKKPASWLFYLIL